jgi:hypothetical protein
VRVGRPAHADRAEDPPQPVIATGGPDDAADLHAPRRRGSPPRVAARWGAWDGRGPVVSGSRSLAAVGPARPVSWRAALEAAVRDEFRGTPLVSREGSPLLPPACVVLGCVRTGFTAPWGRFQARLCHGHWDRWIADGRPPDSKTWLSAQSALLVMAPTVACAVVGCPRAAAKGSLCRAHDRRWRDQGKAPLDEFIRSAPPARRVWTRICRAPDCEFPAGDTVGLCDRHHDTFHAWRHHRRRVGDVDPRSRRIWGTSPRARTGLRMCGLTCPTVSCLSSSCGS